MENGIAHLVSHYDFRGFHVGQTEKCIGLNGPNGESLASGVLLGVEWLYFARVLPFGNREIY